MSVWNLLTLGYLRRLKIDAEYKPTSNQTINLLNQLLRGMPTTVVVTDGSSEDYVLKGQEVVYLAKNIETCEYKIALREDFDVVGCLAEDRTIMVKELVDTISFLEATKHFATDDRRFAETLANNLYRVSVPVLRLYDKKEREEFVRLLSSRI